MRHISIVSTFSLEPVLLVIDDDTRAMGSSHAAHSLGKLSTKKAKPSIWYKQLYRMSIPTWSESQTCVGVQLELYVRTPKISVADLACRTTTHWAESIIDAQRLRRKLGRESFDLYMTRRQRDLPCAWI